MDSSHLENIVLFIRMKGGAVLASGSQGCIFEPSFRPNAEIANPKDDAPNQISKVFADKSVFNSEVEQLGSIQDIVGNNGIIGPAIEHFETRRLNPENLVRARKFIGAATGCVNVATKSNAGGPIYVFNQKKITGDLRFLKTNKFRINLSAIENAFNALVKLQASNIVHLDMADRNIFYVNTNPADPNAIDLLIGDFGKSIDLGKEDKDEKIMKFAEEFFKATEEAAGGAGGAPDKKFMYCLCKQDQLSVDAAIALLLWFFWDERETHAAEICEHIPPLPSAATQSQVRRQIKMCKSTGKICSVISGCRGVYHTSTEICDNFLSIVSDAILEGRTKDSFYETQVIPALKRSDINNFIVTVAPLLDEVKYTAEEIETLVMKIIKHNDYNYLKTFMTDKGESVAGGKRATKRRKYRRAKTLKKRNGKNRK